MKIRPLVAALAAGSLLLGNVGAFAQSEELAQKYQDARNRGYWHPEDPSNPHRGYATPLQQPNARQQPDARMQQPNARNYHRGGPSDQRDDSRYEPRHDHRYDSRYDPRYYQRWDSDHRRYMPGDHWGGDWRGRGAGPQHNWYRGSYLPREYRGYNYVVDDWRAHRLYAPPSGYYWVQAPGGDYLLVAIATGLIASILLNQ